MNDNNQRGPHLDLSVLPSDPEIWREMGRRFRFTPGMTPEQRLEVEQRALAWVREQEALKESKKLRV